jgi:type IV pilus assembly protein PilW
MITFRKQAGVSLVEAMIGLALSMVVVTSMVGLMSNSMGTATRIIEMSQLTDELRNTMSMLTRDVRRANYSANAAFCYANSDCGLDVAAQTGDIVIDGDCITFNLDRNQDGDASTDNGGGFRRVADGDGVGRMEMWVGGNAPDCAANDANWMAVTDDSFVDVTNFTVSDAESFEGSITEEGGATVTQRTRRIDVLLAGELILDDGITRQIQDTIKVRNDYLN